MVIGASPLPTKYILGALRAKREQQHLTGCKSTECAQQDPAKFNTALPLCLIWPLNHSSTPICLLSTLDHPSICIFWGQISTLHLLASTVWTTHASACGSTAIGHSHLVGAEGVQDGISVIISVILGPSRSGAPAKFLPALRVELDQVVQDAESDLLQAGALSIHTDTSQCIFSACDFHP